MNEHLLEVNGLRVSFDTYAGEVKAVRGVDFYLDGGETLAIVGESGCGKSVTVQTIMRLNPEPPAAIRGGSILYKGEDLTKKTDKEMRAYRGKEFSMIFQDAMTSLNPVSRIGRQMSEAIRIHEKDVTREDAKARAIEMLGKPAEETKIITCHLGNGSSISAVKGGKCIDTSMGLTPLEGVPMGTRCGDMDPAIVIYLMKKLGLDAKGMDNYMNKKSGMLGISGVSSDFRDLGAAAAEGNERAELALRTFAYKVKKYIGAYAAALNGVDAIVFTAGVGENDKGMRERILNGLDYLGVEVDFELNRNCPRGENVEISKPGSKVKVFVIPTDEELMIAKDTARLAK